MSLFVLVKEKKKEVEHHDTATNKGTNLQPRHL